LDTLTYDGETKNWNFAKFICAHKEQHDILTRLHEEGLHPGLDGPTKVRHLLDGMRSTTMDAVKNHIIGSRRLRHNFEACVAHIASVKNFDLSANPKDRQVAAVGSVKEDSKKKRKRSKLEVGPGDKPDMSIPFRWYSKEEYQKFNRNQKLGLKLRRDAEGDKKKAKSSKGKGSSASAVSLDAKTIAAISQQVSDLMASDDSSDVDSVDDEKPAKRQKSVSNRDNKALTKKKRG
jgi:hypothetical protein